MVRIGFVGSGLIAWAHALGIKAMIDGGVIDAAITAVHDPRQRRAEGFIEAVGTPGASSSASSSASAAAATVASAEEVAARADA
ncbi:MAG TPA: hypothetical protein VG406_14250, partial [Isosphaeraceae bacterium]|nr:hypothetical protein [Isosphaeraceae bacterium]